MVKDSGKRKGAFLLFTLLENSFEQYLKNEKSSRKTQIIFVRSFLFDFMHIFPLPFRLNQQRKFFRPLKRNGK